MKETSDTQTSLFKKTSKISSYGQNIGEGKNSIVNKDANDPTDSDSLNQK